MLRPLMKVLVGTALLLGCTSGDESAESEASADEGIDTAAMIAEGAMSGPGQPMEDPNLVPVEVSYEARLLIPPSQTLDVKLPKSGRYTASGKGNCRVDERDGSFQVDLADIGDGNLRSFTLTRWKPAGEPYVTNMISASGDMGFVVANDGKDFLDKAMITAKRTGDGATVQFDVETTLRSYSLKGTATCARLSPPIQ